MLNDILHKQKDSVAMGSPVGPTVENVFIFFYEIKWLEQCCNKFKPVFYRRYVDHIFALFESAEHLSKFHAYLTKCHPNISFSFEQEVNDRLSFIDIELSRQQGKFVYRKPGFTSVYNHFDRFCQRITKLVWYTL